MQKISISKLLALKDPFTTKHWMSLETPMTREEILKATPIPASEPKQTEMIWDTESRERHAGRIMWLILNWSDDFPIELDFGMPDIGYITTELIMDGHHRLMAAIMLEKDWIFAECSGQTSYIEQFEYV